MTSYKLNEEKMFADITDGMAIVINGETGIYYGMNSFGTTLFENLIKGASTKVILEKLKEVSEASDIETKFWDFVNIAVEKELLIPRDEIVEVEVALDEAAAIADEFNLNISEYNDAQELLLADPIHEVREETGWSPEKVSLNTDLEDVARREAKMDE